MLEELDETAEQILDAAGKRFIHYGYGKTTMSEIANDCNMSTGNLYRYFPSKMDIAEAFASRVRRTHLKELTQIAEDRDRSPSGKLREFLQTKLRLSYELYHGNPRIYEMSQVIVIERPEMIDEWAGREGHVLAHILEEGDKAGVFKIEDSALMAKVIQDAAFRFSTSNIYYAEDIEQLQLELDIIVDLLLDANMYRVQQAK
ncbi:MAG: TetR/AcrR family transcriptional regulator [Pseudomonadota bacterium]